jgi:hypothetical protein
MQGWGCMEEEMGGDMLGKGVREAGGDGWGGFGGMGGWGGGYSVERVRLRQGQRQRQRRWRSSIYIYRVSPSYITEGKIRAESE